MSPKTVAVVALAFAISATSARADAINVANLSWRSWSNFDTGIPASFQPTTVLTTAPVSNTTPPLPPVTSTPTTTVISTPASSTPAIPKFVNIRQSAPATAAPVAISPTTVIVSGVSSNTTFPSAPAATTAARAAAPAPILTPTATAVSFSTPSLAATAIPAPSSPVLASIHGFQSGAITAGTTAQYDAYINLGAGGFAEIGTLAPSGTAQAWYNSPLVQALNGGPLSQDAINQFDAKVLAEVQRTYALSNVPVSLTTDPNASAAHMLSVVSGVKNDSIPNAVGITQFNADGASFIDKLAPFAKNMDDLSWAVAHNVAHELMHAFNVDHHDQTGQYLDAASIDASRLLDPNTVFGPAAVQDLLSQNFKASSGGLTSVMMSGGEEINLDGQVVTPEPTTVALWGALIGVAALARRASVRKQAA